MAEEPVVVKKFPVAHRVKNGPKVPHVGPHIDDYHTAHKETVGHESDKWWAKVCDPLLPFSILLRSFVLGSLKD